MHIEKLELDGHVQDLLKKFVFLLLFVSVHLHASQFDSIFTSSELSDLPVADKGRFLPLDSYASQWLYEMYHNQTIRTADLSAFHTTSRSPQDLIWKMDFLGHSHLDEAPLFFISSAQLKYQLGLPLKKDRFSYSELLPLIANSDVANRDIRLEGDYNSLKSQLRNFSKLSKDLTSNTALEKALEKLKSKNVAPTEILSALESEYPLRNRLIAAGDTLKMLPGRFNSGEWFSIKSLKIKVYNAQLQQLVPVSNFTVYSDQQFEAIRTSYLDVESALSSLDLSQLQNKIAFLAQVLKESYQSLAGTPILQTVDKELLYPTINQLKFESLYFQFPFIYIAIIAYAAACLGFFFSQSLKSKTLNFWSTVILCIAFMIHTLILLLRCYILHRPPVSNMFETVIYVPWIAVLTALFLRIVYKNSLVLLSASLCAAALLILLEITHLNQSLENVQAVLDSQYWLIVHVLMVVGSYGIFILGGVLGHFYLITYAMGNKENEDFYGKFILQTLYIGTALLVSGTILGGVWAAESWGRFWDWDPKESWAFVSICVYLIVIHAFTFKHIHYFGLAVGSIIGLIAITFTWYGVNYILGTGLHSYGFGSGGEGYYYAFLIAEALFLAFILRIKGKVIST